jgi:hypothetical protein
MKHGAKTSCGVTPQAYTRNHDPTHAYVVQDSCNMVHGTSSRPMPQEHPQPCAWHMHSHMPWHMCSHAMARPTSDNPPHLSSEPSRSTKTRLPCASALPRAGLWVVLPHYTCRKYPPSQPRGFKVPSQALKFEKGQQTLTCLFAAEAIWNPCTNVPGTIRAHAGHYLSLRQAPSP